MKGAKNTDFTAASLKLGLKTCQPWTAVITLIIHVHACTGQYLLTHGLRFLCRTRHCDHGDTGCRCSNHMSDCHFILQKVF